MDIVALKIINAQEIVMIEAICTPIICADLINQNIPYATSNYPNLKGLQFVDSSTNLDKRIDILIGSDYYYSIGSGEILKGKIEGPVAINSLFGWILCGPFENNPSSVNVNFNSVHNMRVHTETMSENFINENIHNIKKNVFEDFNEIKKLENNESVNQFKDNLSFEHGRYSTKLLLKEFHDVLPGRQLSIN